MYFVNVQKGKNEWWRYLVTILGVCFVYLIIGRLPLLAVISFQMNQGHPVDIQKFAQTYNPEFLGISQNFGMFVILLPSILAFFVLLAFMFTVHGLTLGDIASAAGRVRWKRLFTGAGVWLILLVVGEIIFVLINPGNYAFQFQPLQFFALLIIAIIIIPFQAWFEELFFRSYLMRGLGLLTRVRWIPLVLTAAGFGLLHFSNPEVKAYGFWGAMPYYLGFGLLAGLLVILDDGIELNFGVHAINNIYGTVLVTYQSSVLQTPALFKIQKEDVTLMNVGFFVMAILFLIIMAIIYKWKNFGKIFSFIPFEKYKPVSGNDNLLNT